MLVLSRKKGDAVIIDGVVSVRVIEIRGDQVRLGIDAPKEIPVHRHEIFERLAAERLDHPACLRHPACLTGV